jgi:hypothetical protein
MGGAPHGQSRKKSRANKRETMAPSDQKVMLWNSCKSSELIKIDTESVRVTGREATGKRGLSVDSTGK